MAVGDTLRHGSIIGTVFTGRIGAPTTTESGFPAIVPVIEGRAWITGFHQYLLDTADPFPSGYLVPDTFGGTALLGHPTPGSPSA